MIKVDVVSSPGVLSVPDDFDELVEYAGTKFVPADDKDARHVSKQVTPSLDRVVYRLTFAADISRALAASATIVEIEAYVIDAPSSQSTDQLTVAQRILLGSINVKSKSVAAQLKLIAAVDVDLTAAVNNEKASAISSKQQVDVSRRAKRIVARSNKELLDAHLDMPIIESTTLDIDDSQQSDLSPRASALALLARGVDPASVASYTARIDSARSLAGTSLGIAIVPRARDSLIRDRYFSLIGTSPLSGESTADYSADAVVPVPMLDVTASTLLTATLAFPAALIGSTALIRFTLVDAKGVVVDSIEREIDHAENVRLFSVPTLPPVVQVSRPRLGLGTARVTMTQVDDAATSIELYRKSVSAVGRADAAAYTRVLTVDARRSGPAAVVDVAVDATGPQIFRCVPVGALGTRSHVFSSVVLKPHATGRQSLTVRQHSVSLSARIDTAGVVVEVRNIPPGVIGIDVLRRDVITRTSRSSISRFGVTLVGENVLEPIGFLDESVKQGHIYEYTCALVDRHGSRHDAAAQSTIEYVALVENLVDTSLVNQLVTIIDDDDIDFTFDVISNVIDTNMQSVKNLLDTAALLDLFGDEVKDERELLNNLMAHQVIRHNLTTGESESFGTITSESFSDRALRGINGVKPLAKCNSYRYDVHALLRSPDTLIESLIARATLSGKQHSFKPAKFLHPLALTQGSITSPESRARNHARDEMSFGRVGNVATMDLELAGQVPSVIELDVNRLASRRAVIRWRTTAPNDAYDHFIVMRQHLGTRSFVAAAHNVSDSGIHEMPYEFNDGDTGALRFIVVPVLSDYSLGQEVMSPEIVVN